MMFIAITLSFFNSIIKIYRFGVIRLRNANGKDYKNKLDNDLIISKANYILI